MTQADFPHGDLYRTLHHRVRDHARLFPDKLAITDGERRVTYAELDLFMDRVAAALQRDGVEQGSLVVSVSDPSVEQALVFLGTLRAGCVAAPIQPSATPEQIAAMIADARAPIVFLDAGAAASLAAAAIPSKIVRLDELEDWVAPLGARPEPVTINPEDGFNVIYSSGTTGVPKGIVQSHAMREGQFASYAPLGFDTGVTLVATPLYSNTTLVAFLPTIAAGGSVVMMTKFAERRYLEFAQRFGVTHTMLVPIQYKRIMALADFDNFDLSAFRMKTCTSAPFPAALKADILQRWPGVLIEFYGMTEGGGATVLNASEFPHKLHTVGTPAPGHDLRLVDEDGVEVARGGMGEIVGRSGTMMSGYHGREQATRDTIWRSPDGVDFIRHGDIGWFDEDGFLMLMDRKKDMIISGGFNVYPSDIEEVLAQHPAVAECSVVGAESVQWGETPVGFFASAGGVGESADGIMAWANERLGKTQRLSALHEIQSIPRNALGKVLKRKLRDRLSAGEIS